MQPDQSLGKRPTEFIGEHPARGAVLAPMSGISDVGFRRLAHRFGAALVVTEMVAARGLVRRHAEAALRSDGTGITPHVVQLVGRDPGDMAEGARIAEAAGADRLDINMGCPAKRVTGGLAGSALMREPELAIRLVAAVAGAVRIPVSVKMRLGWDDVSRNAPELIRETRRAGAVGFAVHGRTRQQLYAGRADWAAIRSSVEATDAPVLANGDIGCLADARAALAASGAAAVMIGRAAVGQPWLVGEIGSALVGSTHRSPELTERAAAACEHYETLLGQLGHEIGIRHARKHLAAYADVAAAAGFGLPAEERAELVTSSEPARVLRLLRRIYADASSQPGSLERVAA